MDQEAPRSDDTPAAPGAAARLDPAHEVRPATAKAPAAHPAELAAAHAAPLAVESLSPVAEQAADLAHQLAAQQEELDRRAAQVSQQELDLESQLDAAREWFDEQQAALQEREDAVASLPPGKDAPETVVDTAAAEELAEARAELDAESQRLQEREQELDARQASLYEQIERLTGDRARSAEREGEVSKRQEELDRLWAEMSQQRDEVSVQARENLQKDAELEKQRAELLVLKEELDNQEAGLAACESQLAARQCEVEAAVKRFEGLGVTERRIAELTAESEQFAARARHLDQAEAMLAEEKETLAEERRSIDEQRREMQDQFVAERRRIETERAETRANARRQDEQAAATSAQLDQRQAALRQLQDELQAGQREVLEMRLATEETWAQLAGALAPATLTRSIAQVRGKLADHFQHALQQIAERRHELNDIATQLTAEHESVREQRAELQAWATRREEDIEQRAARLIARERELDRQQQHFETLEVRWTAERDDYRQKIQQLLSDARSEPTGKAA